MKIGIQMLPFHHSDELAPPVGSARERAQKLSFNIPGKILIS